jgi:hypothetical protein
VAYIIPIFFNSSFADDGLIAEKAYSDDGVISLPYTYPNELKECKGTWTSTALVSVMGSLLMLWTSTWRGATSPGAYPLLRSSALAITVPLAQQNRQEFVLLSSPQPLCVINLIHIKSTFLRVTQLLNPVNPWFLFEIILIVSKFFIHTRILCTNHKWEFIFYFFCIILSTARLPL